MRRHLHFASCVLACLVLVTTVCSQALKPRMPESETRTARAFLSYKSQGPLALHAFLEQFPKGADLHVHLLRRGVRGDVYPRRRRRRPVRGSPRALKFARPPCRGKLDTGDRRSQGNMTSANQDLYDRLIDAFSMRSFVPTNGFSGHDQFFATFDRFGGLDKRHIGEWVDEMASRAAAQNQQYLELMETPPFGHAAKIAHALGWNPDFAKLRQQLLDRGLRDEVAADRDDVRQAEARRRRAGTLRNAAGHGGVLGPDPVHLPGVAGLRRRSRCLRRRCSGFETVQASMDVHEPGFVGINFVQPEDGLHLHARLHAADEDAGLPALGLSPGPHQPACRRAGAGPGAAGGSALPHPAGRGARPRGTHRARRGRDV
jgi:adenosine deaminase